MGINGLLRNLHPLLVPPPTHHTHRNNHTQTTTHPIKIRHNIQQFASKSLAIDASSWLFKSAYTCSERLVESIERGVRDPVAEQKYTHYMVGRCRELLNRAKISQIYLVFDGIRVPLKAETNAERESRRRVHLEEARRLISLGRREEAREQYNKCVKGTEEMARVVCAEVEKVFGKGDGAKVKCVFSPYEADAQLVKLCVDGVCHAVVTEDSDVLVYSAACRKPFPIIYKLDRKDGSCDVVTMDWLLNPKFLPPSRRSRRRREDSDDGDSEEEDNNLSSLDKRDCDTNATAAPELHSSEIDYGDDDNMMYAPIRRMLPLPLSNISTSKTNSRARRSTSTKESGMAFLSTLRSFAHKEANDPGAGCRLFIQACILSGCDYVPNRLSKVGPITAFKMVADASHRRHDQRFDRVMRALPRGAILQKEVANEDSNNIHDADDENDDSFLSSCDSYNDLKERYLELLTKSEAIFYYHLVKEHATGNIVPLVPHKQPVSSDTAGNLSPSIVSFNSDLSFIGSIEEAAKNIPTAAPPCPRSQLSVQQNNSGWITAKRSVGNVKNTYKKRPIDQSKMDSATEGPQKGTLMYAFSRPANSLNSKATHKSTTSAALKNVTTQPSSSINVSATPKQSNPFSSFTFNSNSEAQQVCTSTLSVTPKISEKTAGTNKSPMFSPFVSNFDYTEAPSARKANQQKNVQQIIDDKHEPEQATKGLDNDKTNPNNDNLSFKNDGIDDVIEGSQVPLSPSRKTAIDENTFDYEIIIESPPIEDATEIYHSKYFMQDTRRGSPRRVSTSPSCKEATTADEGCSPYYAIDLSDEPESPQKPTTYDSSSWSQTSNLSKSSLKRPFKSPYPTNQHSGNAVTGKKPRYMSSGALLAGFAVQKQNVSGKLGTRQRLAARNANGKKSKGKSISIQNFLTRK